MSDRNKNISILALTRRDKWILDIPCWILEIHIFYV